MSILANGTSNNTINEWTVQVYVLVGISDIGLQYVASEGIFLMSEWVGDCLPMSQILSTKLQGKEPAHINSFGCHFLTNRTWI